MENILGMIAAILTTSAFLPQAVKTLITRDTRSISLCMYILFCLGVFLWIIYGIMINSMPIIAGNIITFILAVTILILKLRNG